MTDHLGALTLWATAALLLLWAASAHLRRARDEAAWDRHAAEAVEAGDWRAGEHFGGCNARCDGDTHWLIGDDPTPTHDALLAEVRYLPLQEAMGKLLARDVEAWKDGTP